MNNSMEILNRIEKMLQEKHISVETMTHLEWIQARSAGKQFSMSEHIRAMIYSLLTNNRRWDQVERNIEEIDKIFFFFVFFPELSEIFAKVTMLRKYN